MSYRNPEIIVDRSAEIYAQSAVNVGQIAVKGVQDIYKARADKKAKEKKRQDGISVWENNYRDSISKDYQKTAAGIKNKSYREQFVERQTEAVQNLLELKSKYTFNPGSATKEDLLDFNKKEAEFRRKNIAAKEFATNITLDAEKVGESVMGTNSSNVAYKGLAGDNSQFKNALFLAANQNKDMPGISYEKIWNDDGQCEIKAIIDKSNPFVQKMSGSGFLNSDNLKFDKKGKAQLNYSVDPETYTTALVDVPDGIDNTKLLAQSGVTVGGVIRDEYFDKTYSENSTGIKDVTAINTKGIFQRGKILNNKVLRENIKNQLSIVDLSHDQQLAWRQMRLNETITPAQSEEWLNMSSNAKRNYLADEILIDIADSFQGQEKTSQKTVTKKTSNTGGGENAKPLTQTELNRQRKVEDINYIAKKLKEKDYKFEPKAITKLASSFGVTYGQNIENKDGELYGITLKVGDRKLTILDTDKKEQVIEKILRLKVPGLTEKEYTDVINGLKNTKDKDLPKDGDLISFAEDAGWLKKEKSGKKGDNKLSASRFNTTK